MAEQTDVADGPPDVIDHAVLEKELDRLLRSHGIINTLRVQRVGDAITISAIVRESRTTSERLSVSGNLPALRPPWWKRFCARLCFWRR